MIQEHLAAETESRDPMSRRGPPRLSQEELRDVVELSGVRNIPIAFPKQTVFRVVRYGAEKFKVRAHLTPGSAADELRLVQPVRDHFVHCHGRVDHCLVWEYLEPAADRPKDIDKADIAEFMVAVAATPSREPDGVELESWWRTLRDGGVFGSQALRQIQAWYLKETPAVRRWNLEYVDALPKNFLARAPGQVVCVDAKHLFEGPRGLGLIKLFCHQGMLLSADDYERMKEIFLEQTGAGEFDDPDYFRFLLFFYCLLFLVKNARLVPRLVNLLSRRNEWRRQTVLDAVNASPGVRLAETLAWNVPRQFYRACQLPGRAMARLTRSRTTNS
jgi:hypothetical protein